MLYLAVKQKEAMTKPEDWRSERERIAQQIKQARSKIQNSKETIRSQRSRIEVLQQRLKSIVPPNTNSPEVQLRLSERYFLAYRANQCGWSVAQLAELFDVNRQRVHVMIRRGEREASKRPWPGARLVDQRRPNTKDEPG